MSHPPKGPDRSVLLCGLLEVLLEGLTRRVKVLLFLFDRDIALVVCVAKVVKLAQTADCHIRRWLLCHIPLIVRVGPLLFLATTILDIVNWTDCERVICWIHQR